MPSRILLEASKKGIHLFLKDGALGFKAPQSALAAELRAAITENKLALFDQLKSKQKSLPAAPPIQVRDSVRGSLVTSYGQQQLWLN